VNATVFRHVVRQQRARLIAVVVALVAWGMLMPVVYTAFGLQAQAIVQQFPALQQFMSFGGGDLFTLSGTVAFGYIHPIAIALLAVFAIVLPLSGVAGERQRGTLEIVLARPVSRRSYLVTLLACAILFIGLAMAASLAGTVIGAAATNMLDQIELQNMPLLWLNGVLLYFAIAAMSFAASVSFDRPGPAAAITLALVLVMYFLQIIGSLWPDAAWLQPYSLFYYLKPEMVLREGFQVFDAAVLLVVGAVALLYAWIVFPRRDLAAPA
jgi:beta-exotoxin I transport system permease protein